MRARSWCATLVVLASLLSACVDAAEPTGAAAPEGAAKAPSEVVVPAAFDWPPPGYACYECDAVITCAWTCASGQQGYTTTATSEGACARACRTDCAPSGGGRCRLL
jgi:hypothetical protein